MPPKTVTAIKRRRPLRLRVGELVEVRSRDEILATLDPTGALEGLPFMPEMLAFCGKRLRVVKRAHKTCDTVKDSGLRRMMDTVHLDGSRCDGTAHAGCQAACLIFWKEAWLRRVSEWNAPKQGEREPTQAPGAGAGVCTEAELHAATQRTPSAEPTEVVYRCQATDLREASSPMSVWQPMQFVRDLRSGNARPGELLRAIIWLAARHARSRFRGYRIQVWLFNRLQQLIGGSPFQNLAGVQTRTPSETLGLVPGDRVQVKSMAEIRETLDPRQKARGLYFDVEMTPFCGGIFQVRSRVSRIIHDKTGRMITIPGDCVILDGVACTGRYHVCCPRAIYPYWREIWLRRVTGAGRSNPKPTSE